jgi:hypothetical protein
MSIQNLEYENEYEILVASLSITEDPIIDNTNSNVLVRNATTGAIEINNNILPGDVTGAANLGSGAIVYQGQSGTILDFNTLTGNSSQGVVITPAPEFTGGNIEIGNNYLNQSVTTTSSPTFVSIISDLSGCTAKSLAAETTSTATPIGIDNTSKDIVSLTDIMSTDTAQSVTGIKTFTAAPVISNINNGFNISVPSNISSIFALQSASAQTTGNICTYFNSSPAPAVIQDSGIASSNITTLSGNQTISGIKQYTASPYVGTSANNITYGSAGILFTQGTSNTLDLIPATNANGILTLPSSTGTLALTSQLPSTSGGSYSSTWTNVLGFTAAPSSTNIIYNQVGNVVTCTINFPGVTTGTGTNIARFSLPIARSNNFTGATSELSGISNIYNTGTSVIQGMSILGDSGTNNLCTITTITVGILSGTIYGSFNYQLS